MVATLLPWKWSRGTGNPGAHIRERGAQAHLLGQVTRGTKGQKKAHKRRARACRDRTVGRGAKPRGSARDPSSEPPVTLAASYRLSE